MRASPPLLIQLGSFRVWRLATAVLLSMALAVLLAWASTAPERRATVSWLIFAAGSVALASIARWLWVEPTRPRQLLWDGQTWHVSTLRKGGIDETLTGCIEVAIDAGAWMLLRFRPDAWLTSPLFGRRVVWFPAERRAVPREWHALRYTLHGNTRVARADIPAHPPGSVG